MYLNELIKVSRKKKEYTLTSLAHYTGISYGVLHRLENGKIPHPHPDVLKKLSDVLELELAELMTRSGYVLNIDNIPDEALIMDVPVYRFTDYEIYLKEKKSLCIYYEKQWVSNQKISLFGLHVDRIFQNQFCHDQCLLFSKNYSIKNDQYFLCYDKDSEELALTSASQFNKQVILTSLGGKTVGKEYLFSHNESKKKTIKGQLISYFLK